LLGVLGSYIGPLLGPVRDRFGATPAAAGLVASAWVVSHALIQVPAGLIVDRVGPWRLLVTAAVVAAMGVVVFALATSVAWLAVGRLVVGLGTGAVFIASLEAMALRGGTEAPGSTRGIYGALVNVGASAGVMAPSLLYDVLGWAGTSLTVALGCILLGVGWYPAASFPRGLPSEPGRVLPLWLAEPRILAMAAAHFSGYGVFIGVLTWAVDFVVRDYGRSLISGSLLVAIASLMGVAGRFTGGVLCERIGGGRSVLLAMLSTSLGLVFLALGASLPLVIMSLGVTCFAANLSFSAVFSPELAPESQRSSALGFVSLMGNIGAFVVVLAIAAALQHLGGYRVAWAIVAALVIGMTAAVITLERHSNYRGPASGRFTKHGIGTSAP
jgi:nitrate/nitrite transporter NarK